MTRPKQTPAAVVRGLMDLAWFIAWRTGFLLLFAVAVIESVRWMLR